jgi:purine-binding chemotaxis protein CheW
MIIERSRRDVGKILRERAERLARREDESLDVRTEPYATFTVGANRLGVSLDRVTRAAELHQLTELPGGPPWLLGVTAVEGQRVSLLDLALFLGLRRGMADLTATVVVGDGTREIGLGVEVLLGIEELPVGAVSPMPGANGPLQKIARLDSGEVLLLDVGLLFADRRLARRT